MTLLLDSTNCTEQAYDSNWAHHPSFPRYLAMGHEEGIPITSRSIYKQMGQRISWAELERRNDVVRETKWEFLMMLQFPWRLWHLFWSDSLYIFIKPSLSLFHVCLAHKPKYSWTTTPSTNQRQPFLLCGLPMHLAPRLLLTHRMAMCHLQISFLPGRAHIEVKVYK